MEQLVEFGFGGIMAGITWKVLGLAEKVVKAKLNGGKAEEKPAGNPGDGVVMAKLEVIEKSVKRLERKVIDGNGGEPLTVQVAVINQRLADHVGDIGLHTAER
jgi:hypothetical protein